MKYYFPLFMIIISFFACTKRDHRKVIENTENTSEKRKDIKTFEVADLPIHIDSTSYLIHPIGNYDMENSRSEYFKSENYRLSGHAVSNVSKNKISGNLSNVKFEHLDSTGLKSLTDKTMKIRSMLFLRDIYNKIGKGYFIYHVIDKDTNSDGELDYNDLRSLYISNLNGTNFRKLSPNRQELETWKVILEANTLYLKSIEDIDNNGEYDKKDKTHYFYLDLSKENSKIAEYYPI
ncbi:hypothetical protein [Psychroserpens ponticola]|uniref:EF-hand domain-containing protein n=1 Tax=Psychroserpens ponticola TaxID=2932268 RepID=A0ABY7RVB4_9FLAO|nr:hypothetical protein [Psychroserpens ponticola]WCO00859.1 hypothetical protein MUN68_012370 [Psychroserpens ponticola]